MCVAMPGIVESVENDRAVVNFSGNRVTAHCGFVKTKAGDRVLVHAGYVMQVVKQSEADEIAMLLDEINSMTGE